MHLPQTDVARGKVIIPNYYPYSVHRYSMNTNRKFYLKIVYLSGKYFRIQVTTCYYVGLYLWTEQRCDVNSKALPTQLETGLAVTGPSYEF